MEVLTSDIYGGGTKFDCSQIVGGMTNIDSTVNSLYPVHRYMVCDYRYISLVYLSNISVQLSFIKIASVMDAFINVVLCDIRPQPLLVVSISLVHSQTGDGLAITSQLRIYCSPTFSVGPCTNWTKCLGLSADKQLP